jgi:hypothetical protein
MDSSRDLIGIVVVPKSLRTQTPNRGRTIEMKHTTIAVDVAKSDNLTMGCLENDEEMANRS